MSKCLNIISHFVIFVTEPNKSFQEMFNWLGVTKKDVTKPYACYKQLSFIIIMPIIMQHKVFSSFEIRISLEKNVG